MRMQLIPGGTSACLSVSVPRCGEEVVWGEQNDIAAAFQNRGCCVKIVRAGKGNPFVVTQLGHDKILLR